MYCYLRQITQEILKRKNLAWDGSIIPQELPPVDDDLTMIEMFGVMLNHYFTQIDENKSPFSVINNHLDIISHFKNILNDPWPEIEKIQTESTPWYIHDILFFISLCGHLQESLDFCNHHFDSLKLPSEHACSIYSSVLPIKAILHKQGYLNKFPYLKIALTKPSRISVAGETINQHIDKDSFLLKTSVNRLIRCSTFTMAEENYYLHILSNYLSPINNSNIRPNNYQLLSTSLSLGMLNVSESKAIIEKYFLGLHNLETQVAWSSEHLYWKLFLSYIKTIMPSNLKSGNETYSLIKLIMNQIKQHTNHCSPYSEPVFNWHGSTSEFVKYFHNLIASKKLSIGGNYDMDPYVKKLHQTISIEKDKGAGYLSCGSLLTYFKQLNAEIR
ncbi:hypothetical protein [Carboxylicivirga linearis]|uniref:Uncharacterized protein n=1 Tax=Carboxylicivirga linearis TaxID=1628157 RepID=A0ABS5JW71_9BACT|nr:hypothetical protein [Carboxylicivirga linearis]MBS2099098.1 hypothetical protein [Carboxylicivirga linearis]